MHLMKDKMNTVNSINESLIMLDSRWLWGMMFMAGRLDSVNGAVKNIPKEAISSRKCPMGICVSCGVQN